MLKERNDTVKKDYNFSSEDYMLEKDVQSYHL